MPWYFFIEADSGLPEVEDEKEAMKSLKKD